VSRNLRALRELMFRSAAQRKPSVSLPLQDLRAFLRTILAPGGLDSSPGVLADWLDERGDPRGVLLRKRWERWQKDHAVVVPRLIEEKVRELRRLIQADAAGLGRLAGVARRVPGGRLQAFAQARDGPLSLYFWPDVGFKTHGGDDVAARMRARLDWVFRAYIRRKFPEACTPALRGNPACPAAARRVCSRRECGR
jgi:uncharacterized protein (TIGR02996 family)